MDSTLKKDMTLFHDYLQHWHLKLRTAKTTATTFNLNNMYSLHKVIITVNDATLLGVTLNHSLTYKQHLETLPKKVSWVVLTSILRMCADALVYSSAKYVSPVWYHSAHTKILNATLNCTMPNFTGCMHLTEMTFLPVLARIAPPNILHESRIMSFATTTREIPDHFLHHVVSSVAMLTLP